MISTIRTIVVLFLFVWITACHSAKKISGAQYKLMDTVTVSARNNPMEIYRATSPLVWEILHTAVELHFDFERQQAEGKAILSIRPFTIAPDTLELDAKDMLIKRVGMMAPGTHNIIPLRYTYDSLKLKIDISAHSISRSGISFGTIDSPRQQEIVIEYTSMPYAREAGGSAAITQDRGLYFINTNHEVPDKPVQIWTQGETESNSHWLPTIDKPNQRTTTDISLIVPDTMQTLSNGRLLRSTPEQQGMRRDDWRMEQPIQVYAIMFAIGRFELASDSYKDALGIAHDVKYYTEPAYAPYARGMFKNTPEMIEYFSRATGIPYPWNTYSQVVVRDYVSGAMENTSASLFGEFVNQNNRQLLDGVSEDVVSHELFHQWFGDYVTAESWSNLTLNESFATFGEFLWRRYKYGSAFADELAYDDLGRYLASTERGDPPLVRFYYRDRESMFDRVSYQKGGAILRYIQSIAGDSLFSRAMKIYLGKNALHSAEASQWRLAVEEATGKDWLQFFSQWYFRGGHPVLRVHYAYDDIAGMLKVTVKQSPSPDTSQKYILPITTAIIGGAGQRMENWTISERTQTFTYAYEGGVRPLIIPDAAHVLPGVILEDKKPSEWLRQLKISDNYISKRQAVSAAMLASEDPISLQIMDAGLSDKLASIRTHTLNQLVRVAKETWRTALKAKVAYLLQTDANNKVRAAAWAVVGAWKLKNELPQVYPAINDSSYVIAGAALNALREIDADSAYAIAERLQDKDPKGALQTAVWTSIVSKGDPSDIARFEAKAPSLYGSARINLSNNLQQYAWAVKDDTVYERTLQLILRFTQTENIKAYRYAIGSNIFILQEAYKDELAKFSKGTKALADRLKITERYTAKILTEEKDAGNLKLYKEFGN